MNLLLFSENTISSEEYGGYYAWAENVKNTDIDKYYQALEQF